MVKTLVVATGNPGKVVEMQAHLAELPINLVLKPDTLEVEETGTTFQENARLKAVQVAVATGEWAIADDSGLAVDALNGAPGLYSARYGKTNSDRINRLLTELGPNPNRSAKFICAVSLARPDGTIALEAEGYCAGEILRQPQGIGGFGYDPIFFVPEQGMTFAEMPTELKRQMSHRGRALQQLLPKLHHLLTVGDSCL
ncbi:MAG: RdgB/HAM1 family non-canonical purine NTP pyrophosphatase [Leptolyngbyaceae bacterium]|nr:RdgB/HAM1 family non-canonical purine NTP pyrophosphatase [Leptolyngbyaceae bacterium]